MSPGDRPPAAGAGPPAGAGESSAPVAGEHVLAVEGISSGYGGADILHEVSLTVAERGITCVVGPNGAGKSTLLATISGLLRPRRGRVLLRGEPVAGKSPRQILRMGIVHVPQHHSLFRDMTVRENLELGGYTLPRAAVARRRAAVEEMFPQVAGWAGQKAGSLSGGQQRLVEIARGLTLDPALMILDEPSMGLSPKVLRSVFDAVRMLNASGTAILLVEQNARAGLRLSTHGVVLENGRVRLSGTGREVLEHPEIGALYLGGAVRPLAGEPSPAGEPAAGEADQASPLDSARPGGAAGTEGAAGSRCAAGAAAAAGKQRAAEAGDSADLGDSAEVGDTTEVGGAAEPGRSP